MDIETGSGPRRGLRGSGRAKVAAAVVAAALAVVPAAGMVGASAGGGDNSGPVAKPTGSGSTVSGFASRVLFAVVNADGSLARENQGVAVTHSAGAGSYIVEFDRDVRSCSYTATLGLSGASGTSARGFVTVVGAAASANGVFVTTDDIAGSGAERGFHLQVIC